MLSSVKADPPIARKNRVLNAKPPANLQPVANRLERRLLADFGTLSITDVKRRGRRRSEVPYRQRSADEESIPPLSATTTRAV